MFYFIIYTSFLEKLKIWKNTYLYKHIVMMEVVEEEVTNLPVSYLPHFRETFGTTLFKVTNEEFIKWCKDNDVTLYKTIMTTVEVKIDEY